MLTTVVWIIVGLALLAVASYYVNKLTLEPPLKMLAQGVIILIGVVLFLYVVSAVVGPPNLGGHLGRASLGITRHLA